jgi:hypothetical protein
MPSLSSFFAVKPAKNIEAPAVKPEPIVKPEPNDKKRKSFPSEEDVKKQKVKAEKNLDAKKAGPAQSAPVDPTDPVQKAAEPKKRKEEDIAFSGNAAKGLQRAENAALKITKEGKTPTQDEVTQTLLLLGKDWPEQVRPNVTPDGKPVNGFVLGLVYGLGGQGMKASKITECFPSLAKMLNTYIAATIPDKDFKFSSLQINYNYAAKRHGKLTPF